jgi:uncharacterized protein YodC (DUF2158 family)
LIASGSDVVKIKAGMSTPSKQTFKTGDIVVLKSGGPEMTIQNPKLIGLRDKEWKGGYECQWFAGKKLETGVFPQDSLEIAVPKKN